MLSLLELKHFKCFEHLKLPLSNLTVLSGTNASGKSSVIHALALLRQAMRQSDIVNFGRIALNGNDVKLGTVFDVVDQVTGRDRFEIGLSDDYARCNWAFTGGRRDMSAMIEWVDIGAERFEPDEKFPDFGTDLLPHPGVRPKVERAVSRVRLITSEVNSTTYLTAEREGPREVYPLLDQDIRRAIVGTRGEYAVGALFQRRDLPVEGELALEGTAATLVRQVEARLDTFFPGCRINLSQVQNANAVVLGISTSEQTDFLRPIHCGFGITQILPIIVATLSASLEAVRAVQSVQEAQAEMARFAEEKTDTFTVQTSSPIGPFTLNMVGHDLTSAQAIIRSIARSTNPLILIENPEVHLHPSGQALMGQFLAEAAHAGVQIIAETHSDHVLNGVRRAVKSGKAKADEVAIHFFQDRFRNKSQVLSPMLDPSGNIDVWPEGFFDQFDKDLDYFAGWGE